MSYRRGDELWYCSISTSTSEWMVKLLVKPGRIILPDRGS